MKTLAAVLVLLFAFSPAFAATPPVLSGLSPSSAQTGSGDLVVLLTGSGFTQHVLGWVPPLEVLFDGNHVGYASIVDDGHATITLPSSFMTTVGVHDVTLATGAGMSSPQPFTVDFSCDCPWVLTNQTTFYSQGACYVSSVYEDCCGNITVLTLPC